MKPTFTTSIMARGRNGFAKEDAWSVWYYLSTIIPPMLRQLQKGEGYPVDLRDGDEWHEVLEDMARGFEAVIETDNLRYKNRDTYEAEYQKLETVRKKGMELFVRYFRNLWD